MQDSLLLDLVLPLSLLVIMVGLGMSLTLRDFRRVVVFPRAVLVGLGAQLVGLPLLAFGLATLFALPAVWAVGLMLLAGCPGGPTSNLITFVARGDTALSITLTALSSTLTVVTLPLLLAVSVAHFGVDADAIRSPAREIVLQIVAITALPVSVGLGIRHLRPALANRLEGTIRKASALLFVGVLAVVIVDQRQVLVEHFWALGGVTGALNLATLAMGYLAARAVSLPSRQRLTLAIEAGIQNGTLAIVIAMSILGVSEMAIPAGVYSLLMFVSGGLLMATFGRETSRVTGGGASGDEGSLPPRSPS